MFGLSPVVLGFALFFLGVVFFLFILLLLRMAPRFQPLNKMPALPSAFAETSSHDEAVLLIQSGGRVVYLNQQARKFFDAWEKKPNLESLARRTRPDEAFLTLCAHEGKALFSINGRIVEGTSYFAPNSIRNTSEHFPPDHLMGAGSQTQCDAILVSLRCPKIALGAGLSPELSSQKNEKISAENRPDLISAQMFNIFTELSQTMASSLDLEVTLQTILESVERLIPFDSLEISVWNEDGQYLIPYRLVGLPDQERRLEKGLDRHQADRGYSDYLITQRKSLLVKDVNTFQLVRPTLDRQRYPFQSYLGAPLLSAGNLVGILELASLTSEDYDEGDLEILNLLSGQAAVALNNALLYKKEHQQSTELTVLANIAQAVSSIDDPKDIYARLIEIIFPLIPVEILGFLVHDETRHVLEGQTPFMGIPPNVIELYVTTIQPGSPAEAIWQSGETIVATNAPENPQLEALELIHVMLAASIQHTVLIPLTSGGHMVGYLQAANKRDATAFDKEDLRLLTIIAGQAAPIIENSILARLSRHRAQQGVPSISNRHLNGVIALEKEEPNFYSPEDIQAASTIGDQAVEGLVKAELYQESVNRTIELDHRSQTLTTLNRLLSELSGSLDTTRILDFAVREFQQIIGCTSASALSFEYKTIDGSDQDSEPALEMDSGNTTVQAEYLPWKVSNHTAYGPGSVLPHTSLFTRLLKTKGIFSTEDMNEELELEPLKEFLARHRTRSLLIIPIISGGIAGEDILPESRFQGMLLAHHNTPYRFSADEIELARTISNQVAIALQNARLYEKTRNLTEHLESRVQQRTAELTYEHQRADTLLRIIRELSISLDLDHVLRNTLKVLREYVDAEQITILIARPNQKQLHRLASVGYTPKPPSEGSPTPFNTDQGLAGWIITQRKSALIDDVLQDERWIQVPFEPKGKTKSAQKSPGDMKKGRKKPTAMNQHRSAMGVPLMSGAETLGCLLLFHPEVGHFSANQLELVQAAAIQVAVAVNNAELYRLIRDQAETLGNMLRAQQVETSRSKAILEAVADGVLVTDVKRKITLFNESAERILGLDHTKVVGKSMEDFTGLFGRATNMWMETIRTWSQDPPTHQQGDIYSEQIILEDGRVVSVHLAPVSMGNDFLGTVSIFQDITHQVEVDRLKSEFVATVSHELRTPMTSIKGYIEILLMGAAGVLSDQQAHFLQVAKENTERLTVLVNDLLDISQLESGRVTLSLQPINLEYFADQAIADLKRRKEGDEKSITVTKEVQPSLPHVLGDPERIQRVFDNLMENAYLYNTPGGQITIAIHRIDGEVQVDVKDTGVGIHPDDQERVFERFYRGEKTLALGVSGTGLGLPIVKNLIEMHNGRIWLKSSGVPGKGSTFSFTLPEIQSRKKGKKQKN